MGLQYKDRDKKEKGSKNNISQWRLVRRKFFTQTKNISIRKDSDL